MRPTHWWRQRPMILAGVAAAAIASAAVALYYFGVHYFNESSDYKWLGEFLQNLGANLLSDAIMLLTGIFLIDKLLEAERDRRDRPNYKVVHSYCRQILNLSEKFWCGLIAIGCDQNEKRMKAVGTDPFSKAAVLSVKEIGKVIYNSPDAGKIVAGISHTAQNIRILIERNLLAHQLFMKPELRHWLIRLRDSDFLSSSARVEEAYRKEKFNVDTLGGNITHIEKGEISIKSILLGLRKELDELQILLGEQQPGWQPEWRICPEALLVSAAWVRERLLRLAIPNEVSTPSVSRQGIVDRF